MKKMIIILLVAALAGGGWYAFKKKNGSGKPKYIAAAAELRDLSEAVETTGVIAPENRVEIQPSAAGRIEEILVEEGETINAGEILALMSSSDRVAILDAARSSGEEQYKQWKETYKPIKIISPISGTLILRNVVEGQTVNSGTVLFAISDKLLVAASLDESDVGRVKPGQRATIVLDSYPDKRVRGTVFKILDEGTTKNNVVTYTVKIRPERVPEFFRSQMTANVSFISDQKNNALLIPIAAVRESGSGGKMVLVPGEKGMPVPRDITTGLESGDQVEVVSGLESGDNIIIASGKYVPQQGLQSNPLVFGGRRNSNASQNRGQGRAR